MLALENKNNLDFNDSAQHGLMTQLLRLAHNCLTFDFIGTSTDESSDDLCTVQIPTAWRPAFLEYATLQLFFDLYHSLPSSLSPLALSCLVQIARSLSLVITGVIFIFLSWLSHPMTFRFCFSFLTQTELFAVSVGLCSITRSERSF